MQIFLYYLVKEEGIQRNALLDYYAVYTDLSPQEYFYQTLGGSNLRNWFANWAGRTAGEMDYLTREQFAVSYNHYTCGWCQDHINPFVFESFNTGTSGWFRPREDVTPRGWSYNVFKIKNTMANRYR